MHTFATRLMEEIKGRQQTFEKLVVDGICYYDEFEEDVRNIPQYYSELKTTLSYMEMFANGITLPNTKFRQLHVNIARSNLVEFKSKHLRLYACSVKDGKLVITGGYKQNQEKDIPKILQIVKDFIQSDQK